MERRHLDLASIAELQRQRPIEFATPDERAAYVAAFSARLDIADAHNGCPTVGGDRYGHPTTLDD